MCERKSVLDDEIYSSVDRYPTSKLVGQFFIHELAKRVPPEVVVVNEWNPGLCKSGPVCEYRGRSIGIAFAIEQVTLAKKPAVDARAISLVRL